MINQPLSSVLPLFKLFLNNNKKEKRNYIVQCLAICVQADKTEREYLNVRGT